MELITNRDCNRWAGDGDSNRRVSGLCYDQLYFGDGVFCNQADNGEWVTCIVYGNRWRELLCGWYGIAYRTGRFCGGNKLSTVCGRYCDRRTIAWNRRRS